MLFISSLDYQTLAFIDRVTNISHLICNYIEQIFLGPLMSVLCVTALKGYRYRVLYSKNELLNYD